MNQIITCKTKRKYSHIKEGSVAFDIFIYIIACIVILLTLYPMYYVLILSLSDPKYAITMHVYLFPKGLNFGAYAVLFKDIGFWKAYRNTLIFLVPNTILPIITSMLVAYPLSCPMLKGRKFLTWYLLIPMYFSGGLIPSFLLINRMGLYGSPWALIIPGCFSIRYIILIRSYMRTIPNGLREAAYIDGANIYQVLLHIYLPNCTAILAVIAIYALVGTWNSWYSAFIYLPKRDWQPLQLYLRRVLTLAESTGTEELGEAAQKEMEEYKLAVAQYKYSMILISTLPILASYPFFQRFFIKGVMLGSLKE